MPSLIEQRPQRLEDLVTIAVNAFENKLGVPLEASLSTHDRFVVGKDPSKFDVSLILPSLTTHNTFSHYT